MAPLCVCGIPQRAAFLILVLGVRAQKAETSVSGHKFKIGQLVNYLGRERASGVYQITQLLPPEGGAFQYRTKNTTVPHERIAKEHELRRA
jgi:hypothetical protein